MTIYQAMQLNVKNLKAAISDAPTKKDKHRYIAAMILRNIFCLAFCIIFITFFTTLFGNENSSVGIIGLLAVLSLRFTDLDFNIKQSTLALIASFVICAIAPHLANIVPSGFGLLINFSALLLILILTSHQVSYANLYSWLYSLMGKRCQRKQLYSADYCHDGCSHLYSTCLLSLSLSTNDET